MSAGFAKPNHFYKLSELEIISEHTPSYSAPYLATRFHRREPGSRLELAHQLRGNGFNTELRATVQMSKIRRTTGSGRSLYRARLGLSMLFWKKGKLNFRLP